MNRIPPISIDARTFRALGHALVDELADAIASVPARPVAIDESPSAVHEALGLNRPLPEYGVDAAALLAGLPARLFDHSLFNAHPRFFGYITAPPAPIGVLGDFLASALNANLGSWRLSPAATEIEAETVRWIGELIGFRSGSGGLLVSGGNMANITCFLAARAAMAPWDVRALGAAGGGERRLLAYASTETHTWLQKAADLSGIGTQSIRWIPTDNELRMDLRALDQQLDVDSDAGHVPFIVIGTAGSVSTGAVDPLRKLADLCAARKIWFHVDGAYGGFAAAVPDAPADLGALGLADSIAVDPHKWLYAPLEAGCALVADADRLRAAFAYHPPYYRNDEHTLNFAEYGPQNSRGFRALKVWLMLQQAGASGYRSMIAEDMRLSRALAGYVDATPALQLVTQALSIATFRFVPEDLAPRIGEASVEDYLNRLNEALLERLQREGEAFVSNAVVNGRYVLRACIVNFHTGLADVEALPPIVVAAGGTLDAALRRSASL